MDKSVIDNAIELNDPALAKDALREIDMRLDSSSDQNERVYLLFSSASCYGILGDFEEARKKLGLAFRERPDESGRVTVDFMDGLLFQQEGKYAEALEKLSATLSRHSQQLKKSELRFMYEDIQTRRAFLSVTLDRLQEAIPLLEETLSFDLDAQLRSEALASLDLCHSALKNPKHFHLQ
jgi:tetratricopeptide (TPR) repeat protein